MSANFTLKYLQKTNIWTVIFPSEQKTWIKGVSEQRHIHSGYNDNDNCVYDDDDVESIVDGNDDDNDIEQTTKTSSSP